MEINRKSDSVKKSVAILCLILSFFLVYFLQSNFFTWFNIDGIMPNLYVILVLFIGLFVKRKIGLAMGVVFGIYLDIVLGKSVGITGLVLGIVGALAEILSKNFSKDSRFTIMLMVISTTAISNKIPISLSTSTTGTPSIISLRTA